jgi:hypothetical protein
MTARTETTAGPKLAPTAIDAATNAVEALDALLDVESLPRPLTEAACDLIEALTLALHAIDGRRPADIDPTQPATWVDGWPTQLPGWADGEVVEP